ncbi:DUF402 domain-containing protein [Enterococcus hirae]
MGVPKEGEFVTIQSYKHDGKLHRTWRDTMVLKTSEHSMIGVNDHTLVTESDGRRWVTREPAIVYFHKKYWFNVIAMIREKGVSYYCNLASPFLLDDEALKYIDYDLDIKVFPDGEKRLLDVDEYEMHSQMMNYPNDIDFILKENVKILVDWINNGKGPFSEGYIDIWYNRYKQLSRK